MKKSHSANDSEEFFREEEDEGTNWDTNWSDWFSCSVSLYF